jgi:hypothetical protein
LQHLKNGKRSDKWVSTHINAVIRIATNQRHVIPTQYTLHGHTLEVVDSAKYLGFTIREDLQWSKHIHNTVSKANRTMGFNRRNQSKLRHTPQWQDRHSSMHPLSRTHTHLQKPIN